MRRHDAKRPQRSSPWCPLVSIGTVVMLLTVAYRYTATSALSGTSARPVSRALPTSPTLSG